MRKRCPCCIGAILVVLASHQAIAAPQDDAVKAFKEYVAAVRAGSAEKVLALVEPVPESCKPLLAASVESLIAIERVKTAMAKQFALPKDEEAEEEEGWNMGQPSDETLNQLAGDLVDDNTVKLKGYSLPSRMASVFSLRYANNGDPKIRIRYLNSEK